MASGTTAFDSLPAAWVNALEQVRRRRSKLHYKPAALLVALDMLEQAEDSDYRIRYGIFRESFASLMSAFDAKGADKAWQPFYHLATGEQVWTLWRDGTLLDPVGISPNAAAISREVDEARFREALKDFIEERPGRQTVREAVLNMLREDGDPVCLAAVEEYQRRTALALVETPDEIRRSLFAFNSDTSDYLPFVRHLAKSTTFWVFDPDSRQFGPAKFVGFKGMVASRYLFARTLSPKGLFDGHTTRFAIERVLKISFSPDADLVPQLEDWMVRTLRQRIEDPGGSKWRFVALPSVAPLLDLSGMDLDPSETSLPPNLRIEDILEAAPSSGRMPETQLVDRGIITNWAERDSLNRKLGSFGERLVAELERRELCDGGRRDLAERVEIVAQTQGDGLGFDVLSFAIDGAEKYIEVKATCGGKKTPFMVSENERLRSEILGDSLWLYRLFKTSGEWRLFRLQGAFSKTLQLRPAQYKAVVSDSDLAE